MQRLIIARSEKVLMMIKLGIANGLDKKNAAMNCAMRKEGSRLPVCPPGI